MSNPASTGTDGTATEEDTIQDLPGAGSPADPHADTPAVSRTDRSGSPAAAAAGGTDHPDVRRRHHLRRRGLEAIARP